jgi:hypothetical protein
MWTCFFTCYGPISSLCSLRRLGDERRRAKIEAMLTFTQRSTHRRNSKLTCTTQVSPVRRPALIFHEKSLVDHRSLLSFAPPPDRLCTHYYCNVFFRRQPPLLPLSARHRHQARLPQDRTVQPDQHRVRRAFGGRFGTLHFQRAAQAVLVGAAAVAATTGVVGSKERRGFFDTTVTFTDATISVVVLMWQPTSSPTERLRCTTLLLPRRASAAGAIHAFAIDRETNALAGLRRCAGANGSRQITCQLIALQLQGGKVR